MPTEQKLTLKSALDLFLLECEARQFTDNTLRYYRQRLGQFVTWCAEQDAATLADITAPLIRAFLVERARTGISSAYLHSYARAVKTFLNYCVRDELIAVSPFKRVKMPKLEKKILPAVTPAEIKRVLSACGNHRDQAIILLMLDSGLRASELCALDMGDVDMSSGAVHVRIGKGQKDRISYIGPHTRKRLARYLHGERIAEHDALFVSQQHHTRMTYYGLAQLLNRLRIKANVPNLTAHALRRTFALNSLRAGMNIFVLAKLMGHADLTVLRQYLQLVEDDLQEAHKRADVVGGMLRGARGPPTR